MQQLYGSVAPMQAMFQALLDSAKDESDEDEAIPQWLSTHPGLADRIEALSNNAGGGE